MKNNCKLLIYSLCTFFLFPFQVRSQTTHFTPEDGLGQSTVYSLLEDEFGTLWISTANGVSRYDGSGFNTVPLVNAPFGKVNAAQGDLFNDGLGHIWIGGLPGLYRSPVFNAGFESMNNISSNLKKENTVILCANKSHIWLLSKTKAILEVDVNQKSEKLWDLDRFLEGTEYVIRAGVDTDYLCVSTSKNVYIFSRKTQKLISKTHLQSNNPEQLFHAEKGTWIITFLKAKPQFISAPANQTTANTYREILNNPNIYHLYKSKSQLFAATHHIGIVQYNWTKTGIEKKKLEEFRTESGKSEFRITAMCMDRNLQLWIGTDGDGLYKLPMHSTVLQTAGKLNSHSPEIRSQFIKSFLQDKYNRIWVATTYGGIHWYDENFNIINNQLTLLNKWKNASVSALYKDNKGRIWIGAEDGIYSTNDDATELSRHPVSSNFSGASFFVSNFTTSGNGRFFCATSQGVMEYDSISGTWDCVLSPGVNVLMVFADKYNRIFESNYWTELLVYPEKFKKNSRNYLQGMFMSLNSRNVMFDFKRNRYVVSTESGLKILDKDLRLVQEIGIAEGLTNLFTYGTLMDKNGNYWVSTNQGIHCIFPDKKQALHFGIMDGAQSAEFNSGAFFQTRKGEMLFGGISGFNYFYPEAVLARAQTNKLKLLSAWFYSRNRKEKIAYNGKKLELDPNFSELEITFTLGDFRNPGGMDYYYKLNENSWIHLGNKTRIQLSSLASGSYSLIVRCVDQNGRIADEKILLQFAIATSFYKTGWFLFLVVLIAGLLVFAITRYLYKQRMRIAIAEANKIKEINSLRLNISRELHDNLGASLSRVSLLTHRLKEMPQNTDVNATVASISKIAAEMNGQVRNIVWSIDNNYDNLESLRFYMRQYASTFLEENQIDYTIDFSENNGDWIIGPDVRQVLYSVLKETLNNTVKYSKTKKAEIVFQVTDNGNFVLRICDFGVGFDVQQEKPMSNGLRNIKGRLEELGYHVRIYSSAGNGCEVYVEGNLKLPLK
ncbi:MAG: hypothetical protein KG003_04625 [Bacteroidetes bacterium]|nr:hypothetical protein [Bacteroidota bacterium]